MSVYTPVSQQQLEIFLAEYPCGSLLNFTGISDGIENTNYFVTTTQGAYVLTLFELLGPEELPYFLELMAFFAEHQVPSAHPVADKNGSYLRILQGKPAALVERLPGKSIVTPGVEQCAAIGHMLGFMHRVGQAFSGRRANDRGLDWWRQTRQALAGCLTHEETALLDDELSYQSQQKPAALPDGVIHADLFRDNALFEGQRLSGIIDFYYACHDHLLYDVAVTTNDWCCDKSGELDYQRALALLQAYHRQRPLQSNERAWWPVLLRAAALRFWLSRLQDLHFQREGEITHTKDPAVFQQLLIRHRQTQDVLLACWDEAQST